MGNTCRSWTSYSSYQFLLPFSLSLSLQLNLYLIHSFSQQASRTKFWALAEFFYHYGEPKHLSIFAFFCAIQKTKWKEDWNRSHVSCVSCKYDHRVMYKKYTTPYPIHGIWDGRKTSWDGEANKKIVLE